MKSRIYLVGLVCTLLVTFSACQSKQSAYQAAYEAAKEKEMQENKVTPPAQIEEVTPVTKTTTTPVDVNFQKEKITMVDGADLKPYCVVIGSFVNKTNADSLKERMKENGYSPTLAQNEKGMYRVIIATFDNRVNAVSARDAVKERFAPDFDDAWLLHND